MYNEVLPATDDAELDEHWHRKSCARQRNEGTSEVSGHTTENGAGQRRRRLQSSRVPTSRLVSAVIGCGHGAGEWVRPCLSGAGAADMIRELRGDSFSSRDGVKLGNR